MCMEQVMLNTGVPNLSYKDTFAVKLKKVLA